MSQEDWKCLNEEKCRQADISRHKSSKTRAEADKLRNKEEAEALTLKVIRLVQMADKSYSLVDIMM